MAPGCYSPALESAASNKQSVEQRHQEDASLSETSLVKLAAIKLETSNEPIFNQIPLPLTPPPPKHDDDEEDDAESDESSDEEEEESDDEASSDSSSSDEEEEEQHKQDEHEKKEKQADTFEILEQTIMKQKRLAKLKNTDLRRKVLLKRTFDRVLEIMDAENGFNDDLDTPSSQPVVVVEQPTITIEDEEPSVIEQPMEQPAALELELELHPDPSSRMDDIEDDSDDSDEGNEIDDSTTLVKLDDIASTTTDIESTARVPQRHLKRRSSASSDDDDDEDDQVEENQFVDDDFYECYYDQQLNYRCSKLDRHQERRTHGLYSDTTNHHHQVVRVNSKSAEAVNSKRSNHPRKKLKSATFSA